MNNANNVNYADENSHFSVQQSKLSVTNDEIDQSNHMTMNTESIWINTDDESHIKIPSFEQYGENSQNRL